MVGTARLEGPRRAAGFLFAPWCTQVALIQAVSALAWLLYLYVWAGSVGHSPRAGTAIWWCAPGMSSAGAVTGASMPVQVASDVPMWLLMATAMMLPGVLPAAQHVATNTFRRGRSRAVGVFLGTYLLVWLAFGVAAELLITGLSAAPAGALFSVVLVGAAAYELTTMKRWALNRCHRSRPLPPSGLRGLAGVARFAWVNASGCVVSCWLSMLAMLAASGVRPLAMVGVTVAVTYERLTRRPRSGRQRVAVGYTGVAALFALAAV